MAIEAAIATLRPCSFIVVLLVPKTLGVRKVLKNCRTHLTPGVRDPAADSAALADALLGYLETGTPTGDITFALEYMAATWPSPETTSTGFSE